MAFSHVLADWVSKSKLKRKKNSSTIKVIKTIHAGVSTHQPSNIDRITAASNSQWTCSDKQ